jgi:hypothetical protein
MQEPKLPTSFTYVKLKHFPGHFVVSNGYNSCFCVISHSIAVVSYAYFLKVE